MRVWDVPVNFLCTPHLLGQHLEVHTIYNVITLKKKGYANHPETLRWVNWVDELVLVHNETVEEMEARGMNHKSPIDFEGFIPEFRTNFGIVDPVWRQIHELYRKGCECHINDMQEWYDLVGRKWDGESYMKDHKK